MIMATEALFSTDAGAPVNGNGEYCLDYESPEHERLMQQYIDIMISKTAAESDKIIAWGNILIAYRGLAYSLAYKRKWLIIDADQAIHEWETRLRKRIQESFEKARAKNASLPASLFLFQQTKWLISAIFTKHEKMTRRVVVDEKYIGRVKRDRKFRRSPEISLNYMAEKGMDFPDEKPCEKPDLIDARMTILFLKETIKRCGAADKAKKRMLAVLDAAWVVCQDAEVKQYHVVAESAKKLGRSVTTIYDGFQEIRKSCDEFNRTKRIQLGRALNVAIIH